MYALSQHSRPLEDEEAGDGRTPPPTRQRPTQGSSQLQREEKGEKQSHDSFTHQELKQPEVRPKVSSASYANKSGGGVAGAIMAARARKSSQMTFSEDREELEDYVEDGSMEGRKPKATATVVGAVGTATMTTVAAPSRTRSSRETNRKEVKRYSEGYGNAGMVKASVGTSYRYQQQQQQDSSAGHSPPTGNSVLIPIGDALPQDDNKNVQDKEKSKRRRLYVIGAVVLALVVVIAVVAAVASSNSSEPSTPNSTLTGSSQNSSTTDNSVTETSSPTILVPDPTPSPTDPPTLSPTAAPTPSCSEKYGRDILICRERSGDCTFLVALSQQKTCDDYCSARGGTCLRADSDIENTCEIHGQNSCDAERDDNICTCTLEPSQAEGPVSNPLPGPTPTTRPTNRPTRTPMSFPTDPPPSPVLTDDEPEPTRQVPDPTKSPIADFTPEPTPRPIEQTPEPTVSLTDPPTESPTDPPTESPTDPPTESPTKRPTREPTVPNGCDADVCDIADGNYCTCTAFCVNVCGGCWCSPDCDYDGPSC
jgi:hypothetical protein